MAYGEWNNHVTDENRMTMKASRDPSKTQYLENNWRCYLATMEGCSKAERSAIGDSLASCLIFFDSLFISVIDVASVCTIELTRKPS